MSPNTLIRLNGVACIFGGIFLMAFVLVHPWDQLLGAAVARTPQWRLAHTFHFVGAAFALVGLPGLFAQQRAALGWLGLTGFALSFLGNAMFLGTGMITAFIWPMLAVDAPTCVEVGGPIFGSPVSVLAFALTALILVIGYLLFCIATLWAGVLPRAATLALLVGAILGMLPPHPVGALPWWALVLGGVLYGASLVLLGGFLWMKNGPAPGMVGRITSRPRSDGMAKNSSSARLLAANPPNQHQAESVCGLNKFA
jgi:hypothetical protein